MCAATWVRRHPCREALIQEAEAEKRRAGLSHVMSAPPASLVSAVRMTPDKVEEAVRRKIEQRTREPAAQFREGA